MTLQIRVDRAELVDTINKIKRKFQNPRDLLQEIGEVIVEDIKARIVRFKADPQENAWAPWAESTRKGRERKGNEALGLLYDTGTLLHSIKAEVKNHGSKGGWNVQVGTNVKYAKYLHEGTEKMPARPFLGVSHRAQKSVNEALKMYMKEFK